MDYKLDPKLPLSREIKRILTELTGDSLKHLNNPGEQPDEAVHEFRKNMKKSRAALRLIRDGLNREQYRQLNVFCRDLSRQLAPVRDAKVLMDATRNLLINHNLPGSAFSAYDYFTNLYHERTEGLKSNLDDLRQVSEKLEDYRQTIADLQPELNDNELIYRGIRRVYRRGRKAMQAVKKHPGGEQFHEWRKRTKYLWYHVTLLENAWPAVMNGYMSSLDILSGWLGEEHDLFVLKNVFMEDSQLKHIPEHEKNKILDAIESGRKELQDKCWPVGEKMYFEKPGTFAKRIIHYWEKKVNDTRQDVRSQSIC